MKRPTQKLLRELANKGGSHKIGELTIDFIFKRNPARLDSFWFHDSEIMTVFYKDRYVTAVCTGDMRVTFDGDDTNEELDITDIFEGDSAAQEAIDRGYSDKNIRDANFIDGNWIELEYGLILTEEHKKDFLDNTIFWRDKMKQFVELSKMPLDKFKNQVFASLFDEDNVINDYDEALADAVRTVVNEEFWRVQKGELINEMYNNL